MYSVGIQFWMPHLLSYAKDTKMKKKLGCHSHKRIILSAHSNSKRLWVQSKLVFSNGAEQLITVFFNSGHLDKATLPTGFCYCTTMKFRHWLFQTNSDSFSAQTLLQTAVSSLVKGLSLLLDNLGMEFCFCCSSNTILFIQYNWKAVEVIIYGACLQN